MSDCKIDAATALAMYNNGLSVRQIAKQFPGASHMAAWAAIRRAVKAGGVLQSPHKMRPEEFAKLTIRIWRAMRKPQGWENRDELVAACTALVDAVLGSK